MAQRTDRTSKADVQTMLRDPAAVFKTPRDVLCHPSLTRDEQLAILRQWEVDARSLSVAEEEGMAGGEESLLSRVRRAIAEVVEGPPASSSGTISPSP